MFTATYAERSNGHLDFEIFAPRGTDLTQAADVTASDRARNLLTKAQEGAAILAHLNGNTGARYMLNHPELGTVTVYWTDAA